MESRVSYEVIGCAMRVHSTLGCGFLERVYANALAIELQERGVAFQREVRLLVRYHEIIVGKYFVDLIVENDLLLEIKAIRSLDSNSESQLVNYLNASQIQTGLLINFGSNSLQFKRMTIAQNRTTS